jgi:hypothetical protein
MSQVFNFPPDPAEGQIFVLPDGNEVQWNGYTWIALGSSIVYPLDIPLGGTNATTAPEALINLGAVGEAPNSGFVYARQNTIWEPITGPDSPFVNKNGDTMNGFLTLDANPTNPMHAATKQYVDSSAGTTGSYVLKAGDTMSGPLLLPTAPPAALQEAVHKDYVDRSIAAQSLYQGVWQVAANIPDLTPATANPLHSYSWVAITVDPMVPELGPAGVPGLDGVSIAESDTIIWNNNTSTYEIVRPPSAGTGQFLPLTGGVMTGHLEVNAPAKVIVKGDPPDTTGMVSLAGGAVGRTGMVEFYNDAAQRLARFGWGTPAQIEFRFENGCTGLKMDGGGMSFGTQVGADPTDVSKHIMLYAGTTPQNSFGIGVTGGRINYSTGDDDRKHVFLVGPDEVIDIDKTGISLLKGEIYATPADTNGITFSGGGRIYKESGTGMVLRKSSGGQQWTVENVDKSGRVYLATTSLVATVEDQIRDVVTPLLVELKTLRDEIAELKKEKSND